MDGGSTFEPRPETYVSAAVQAAVVGLGVAAVLYWWKRLPVSWSVGIALACAVGLVANSIFMREWRGHDVITVFDWGVRVRNRRHEWKLQWQEIGSLYRMKDELIFETPKPQCKRFSLKLDGHEEHSAALIAAISANTKTLNLGWIQTLGDLFG